LTTGRGHYQVLDELTGEPLHLVRDAAYVRLDPIAAR